MSRIVPIDDAPPLAQRRSRNEDGGHLAWLRTLGCIVTGTRPVEAAHVRYADRRFGKRHVGLQEKPDDKWAVPLCADMHRDQHASGDEQAWWAEKNIDPVAVASALWGESGNDEAAEVILREARANAK